MALTQSNIDQIQQLSGAVGSMIHVTDSDNASRAILQQIERLAAGPQPGKPERTPIDKRITIAQEESVRGVYGLFATLCRDQDATIAELTAVAKHLGYKNIGIITI